MCKILILMTYYNRPKLLKNSLRSLLAANEYYTNWELFFGDDNSPIPGEPIVKEILKDHLDKVHCINSGMSFEDKISKGLVAGRFANEIIKNSDANLAIILSDDDELFPTYLKEIAEYFTQHPDIMYAYSKIHIFNPLFEKSHSVNNLKHKYNYDKPINPVNKLDASQVAFRLSCPIVFPCSTFYKEPCTINLDASLFQQLYDKFGECHPTGFVAQYKGVHEYQLVWHKKGVNFPNYIKMLDRLGGELF